MAGDLDESRPLIPAPDAEKVPAAEKKPPQAKADGGWMVDGLPVPIPHGSVVGEPVIPAARGQWSSGLFSCLGRNDEFCSSDVEVCLIGSVAPCLLFGSNVERLSGGPGTFLGNCLSYAGLFMLGNSLFGWNCLAPWLSHSSRTAIRRKFNLEGGFEAFSRSCGCRHGIVEDDDRLEQIEMACDLVTHYLCHACAICQEGRELRRRLPHPGFNSQPVFVMAPPAEQTMGRGEGN